MAPIQLPQFPSTSPEEEAALQIKWIEEEKAKIDNRMILVQQELERLQTAIKQQMEKPKVSMRQRYQELKEREMKKASSQCKRKMDEGQQPMVQHVTKYPRMEQPSLEPVQAAPIQQRRIQHELPQQQQRMQHGLPRQSVQHGQQHHHHQMQHRQQQQHYHKPNEQQRLHHMHKAPSHHNPVQEVSTLQNSSTVQATVSVQSEVPNININDLFSQLKSAGLIK